jgi:hypothetical protein
VKLRNYSLPNTWLTLSDNFGILYGGQSDTVHVHFNAQDLPPKTYSCNIVVNDLFNNSVIIPVQMNVLDTNAVSGVNDRENFHNVSCHPNPFSNFTRIEYSIPHQEEVTVEVYDMKGRRVKTLVSKMYQAGNFSLVWNGTDDSGNPVSTGVYYCRFHSSEKDETIKMILMR